MRVPGIASGEVTPGRLQKAFFGNGGAEAIEGAFRLGKRNSGK